MQKGKERHTCVLLPVTVMIDLINHHLIVVAQLLQYSQSVDFGDFVIEIVFEAQIYFSYYDIRSNKSFSAVHVRYFVLC